MWFLFSLLVVMLLFLFPKQMSIVLGVSALFGAVGGGYYYLQQQERLREEAAVAISVRYDPEQCSPDKSLQVLIQNQSSLSVERVDWVFSARRRGYRSELTGDWLKPHQSSSLIAPGSQWSGCIAPPVPSSHVVKRKADDPANLDISIRSYQVHFVED